MKKLGIAMGIAITAAVLGLSIRYRHSKKC